jgi:hypothetical protein
MTSIILRYSNKTFEAVSVKGAPTAEWDLNSFDILVPPTTLVNSTDLLNKRMNVTTYIASDGITLQETYTYNVSDLQNNTLGSIQYIFNYINGSSSGATTSVDALNSTVFVANGVFATYAGAQVYQTFNNVTGERLVTISAYGCNCSC